MNNRVNLKKKALIILNALLKYVKYLPTYEVIFLLSFGWTHRFAPIYIIMCIRLREVFRFVLFDSAQLPNDGAEAEYQEINQSQLQRADAQPVNLSGGQ